jgi:hypothetical protein
MDLTQNKLSRAEWTNIEVSVSDAEKTILKMIIDGYHNVNLRRNDTLSMRITMKLEDTIKGIDEYLYQEYFETIVNDMISKYGEIEHAAGAGAPADNKKSSKNKKITLRSGELIRINSIDKKLDTKRGAIFEYILLDFCREILKSLHANNDQYAFHLYTMMQVRRATISGMNPHVLKFVDSVINHSVEHLHMSDVLSQAYKFIEKNPHLLKYEDKTLFEHQKQIFTAFRYKPPANTSMDSKLESMALVPSKLVLYTAPTGTGKTLTPLGLSEGYRIIFICAARHIGLALAKSAVSMNKRIAIAFGCETADDIRLHYYAASDYTLNQRTGGIGRVNNSVGDKVEIMICDVQSYLIAMHYMLAFSPTYEGDKDNVRADTDLITYWDEPTISMDYDEHPLHSTIQSVWRENRISKIVLSCATLPHEDEITDVLGDYRAKFAGAKVETISSHDCRKSIALLNPDGKSVVPHLLYRDYEELQKCVAHCMKNKTMLRYFDLSEVTRLLYVANNTENALAEQFNMETYFEEGIGSITMNSIKIYYLCVLQNINPECWVQIYDQLSSEQRPKFAAHALRKTTSLQGGSTYKTPNAGEKITRVLSVTAPVQDKSPPTQTMPTGVSITTCDAHTLTDGPSIFLADNVENIGRFYIKTSQIPERVFKGISENIARNNVIQRKLSQVEQQLEDKEAAQEAKEPGSGKGDNKKNDHKYNRDVQVVSNGNLHKQLGELRASIQPVNLDHMYIPNTHRHQSVWVPGGKEIPNAFVPRISDEDVCEIMALEVDDDKKILLLLGIGMFVDEKTANPRYIEIMKRLANEQQLFVILASSDYIYGTNYQFCHGFIGKDLKQMTQQKTIQAMGRIGRNQVQQDYTIRFRDNSMLQQLFQTPAENKEAVVMSRLFG